jgi:hypothetical protein
LHFKLFYVFFVLCSYLYYQPIVSRDISEHDCVLSCRICRIYYNDRNIENLKEISWYLHFFYIVLSHRTVDIHQNSRRMLKWRMLLVLLSTILCICLEINLHILYNSFYTLSKLNLSNKGQRHVSWIYFCDRLNFDDPSQYYYWILSAKQY